MADLHDDGDAQILDVEDEATGAKTLTDAVCKQILSRIGGDELVEMYDAEPTFAN
jgi:hypothetical protein